MREPQSQSQSLTEFRSRIDGWETRSTLGRGLSSGCGARKRLDSSTVSLGGLRRSASHKSVASSSSSQRLAPLKMRPYQRSRQSEVQEAAAQKFKAVVDAVEAESEEGRCTEEEARCRMVTAESSYRGNKLEESMSRKAATEERAQSLMATMRRFCSKEQGNSSAEHDLRRALTLVDTCASGRVSYPEFQEAMGNYGGLKALSKGALRAVFDWWDEDREGSISHADFVQSIFDEKSSASFKKRAGYPLGKPPMRVPRREGFEARPPVLGLGELTVGVVYGASVSLLNTGDTDLRLRVKILGFDAAVDPSPVRIVDRPHGLLAPGMRAKVELEVLVRAPGRLRLELRVSSESACVDVPLWATFVRRSSVAVPTSSTMTISRPPVIVEDVVDEQEEEEDDASTVFTTIKEEEVVKPLARSLLPYGSASKHAQRLSTPSSPQDRLSTVSSPQGSSVVRAASAVSVWPSLPEQWTSVQSTIAEASALLLHLDSLRGCPWQHRNSVAVRLRRFSAVPGETVVGKAIPGNKQHHSKHRSIIFVANGTVQVLAPPPPQAPGSSRPSSRAGTAPPLLLLGELKAPFHVGESIALRRLEDDSILESPLDAVVVAKTAVQGFVLRYEEVEDLVSKSNVAMAMIRRVSLQAIFERSSRERGGLLRCNFHDPSFCSCLVGYTRENTHHELKAGFAWRQLSFAAECRSAINEERQVALGGEGSAALSAARFQKCLGLADGLLRDFVRDPELLETSFQPRSALGTNLCDAGRSQTMLDQRKEARDTGDLALLAATFTALAEDVENLLQRTNVLEDFAASSEYRAWLAKKFPLEDNGLTKQLADLDADLIKSRKRSSNLLPSTRDHLHHHGSGMETYSAQRKRTNSIDYGVRSLLPPSSPLALAPPAASSDNHQQTLLRPSSSSRKSCSSVVAPPSRQLINHNDSSSDEEAPRQRRKPPR